MDTIDFDNKRPYRKIKKQKPKQKPKSFPVPCTDEMTFQECELTILRQAVDEIEDSSKRVVANSEDVKRMIEIVEKFLQDEKCICYGGTAINNILPTKAQFYNRDIEIPDYDFYSKTPIEHAKKLADIYYSQGYLEVEAKAGIHYGTYKVFVNFIPMADITYLHSDLFENLTKEAVNINEILYAPANFLRMGMYLELSRPDGDVSRWEKVLKRMTLLNSYYPIEASKCHQVDFQRKLSLTDDNTSSNLYYIVRDSLIDQGAVFFGGYAGTLYSRYMPSSQKRVIRSIPDFDVLCENAELSSSIVSKKLRDNNRNNVEVKEHKAIGEVIPKHYEIIVNDETIAFVYEPIACHNYNEIVVDNSKIRIATIDTILSFYLAFLYSNHAFEDRKYKDRLMCMSKFLFEVEEKNRLSQKGLLKRFSLNCYGVQPTIESIRAQKTEMFRKLRKNRGDKWDAWFLKYNPKTDSNLHETEKENEPKQLKVKKRKTFKKKNPKSLKSTIKKRIKKVSEYLF
jgi:hypothetical protein